MTQTRIPTELLLHITNYLTSKDKKECLLICKDWYEVFRFGLYNSICIENLCQLKLLFASLLRSNHDTYSHRSSIIPNGHVVRSLFIYKRTDFCTQKLIKERVIIPKVLFEQLPDLCPNLELLDFDTETWKFIHYHHNVSKWKRSMLRLPTLATMGSLPFIKCLGEGITTLSIQSEMIVDISTQQKLYSILSLVPNIKDLSIIGNKTTTSLVLTLEDIELIHTLLPCLESFSIIGDSIQMVEPSSSFTPVENFPTARRIKLLHWNTISAPVTWLLYVAHKYPFVQFLTVAIRDSHLILQDRQKNMVMYKELLRKCRQIQKISLSSSDLSAWFNDSFFEVLQSHCKHIKDVSPITNKDNQIKYDLELCTALKVRHLITALEVEQWRLDATLPCTIRTLRDFTKLSYLELKCDSYHDTYDMDILLDACPLLEHLVLIWGTLLLKDTQPQKRRQYHPLRLLSITFVAFHQQTFQYLTNQCRSLSTLIITRCKQLCELKNISTQTVMKLNMPHNSFDLIILDGVRLDYSVASMFSGPTYIRILCANSKWYQHVAYNNKKSPIIRLLDDKDSQITKDYFLKREKCTFVNSNYRFLETLSEQKVNCTLKTNLMFGFVEINCKYLKHFVLDGNFTSIL